MIAHFTDGPLAGQVSAYPKFMDRIAVPLPPPMPPELTRPNEWDMGRSQVGYYEMWTRSVSKPDVVYFHWKGTNNMTTAHRIEAVTGRKPGLTQIEDAALVVIDSRSLDLLLTTAERYRPTPKQTVEVTVEVDGEVVAILPVPVNDTRVSAVDLPVRRKGMPHRLTIAATRRD